MKCKCENLNKLNNYHKFKLHYKHPKRGVETILFTDDNKWFIETVKDLDVVVSTIKIKHCPLCGRKLS